MGGGGGGEWGGGEDSFSLVFENSIVLIKCTLYDTVFQRQVSICRGVVFSYSFSIYCAAYHGIWCSVGDERPERRDERLERRDEGPEPSGRRNEGTRNPMDSSK